MIVVRLMHSLALLLRMCFFRVERAGMPLVFKVASYPVNSLLMRVIVILVCLFIGAERLAMWRQ